MATPNLELPQPSAFENFINSGFWLINFVVLNDFSDLCFAEPKSVNADVSSEVTKVFYVVIYWIL